MRMWMIRPTLLCNKHLLGEHNEIHKHRNVFEKKQSIKGRIRPPAQIIPAKMQSRHDELSAEMQKRDFNHQSPYQQPDISHLIPEEQWPLVSVQHNLRDLCNRCEDCRERILREYA